MANESCIAKEKTRRVRVFPLDSCGRMLTGAAGVLDFDGYEAIALADLITEGTIETIQTTSGATCRSKRACPTDNGQTVGFTECVENNTLKAILGFGTLSLGVGGVPNGFNRKRYNCNTKVAVEILFEMPSTDACTAGAAGVDQCLARLYPLIANFSASNVNPINGTNVLRNTYTGTTELNENLFANFIPLSATLAAFDDLDHWGPHIAAVAAGDSYYLERVVPCPINMPAQTCELRQIT